MKDIVEAARHIFFGNKQWVYGAPQGGGANNPNAFLGNRADCTYLTYQASLHAGYNVPYLNTTGLVRDGALTDTAKKYYEVVDPIDARPGDTIYYPAGGKIPSNHVMVLTSWDGGTGTALGAQSTRTGIVEGLEVNKKDSYWKEPSLILRPKASTYVPELDLTGGAGTGFGSSRVSALVNLLKTEGVEGYRPGIYTDSLGVPTVGNGLALVINGSKGYALRSEDEIKGLFRMAGIPESKYDELPFENLNAAVAQLKAGNATGAKILFGNGKNPGSDEFSLSEAQADRISAAYIVAYTVPRLIKDLGGPASISSLSDGEFVAVGSKVYQNPSWLTKNPAVVTAILSGDDSTLSGYFSGDTIRAKAEAKALVGEVNTANVNLGSSYSPEPTAAGAIGHWEDHSLYSDLGLRLIENMVWVADPGSSTGTSSLSGTDAPRPSEPAPKSPSTLAGMTYLSRDGASATLGNGKIISAGPDGRLVLEADGGITATRPAAGFDGQDGAVYDVTSYSRTGQISGVSQIQIIGDPAHPGNVDYNTFLKQGDWRVIPYDLDDGTTESALAVFQVGNGWVDPSTGQVIQTIKEWQAAQTLAPEEMAYRDAFRNALLDAFEAQDIPVGEVTPGMPPEFIDFALAGIQIAAATNGVTTDGGLVTGYGTRGSITFLDADAGLEVTAWAGEPETSTEIFRVVTSNSETSSVLKTYAGNTLIRTTGLQTLNDGSTLELITQANGSPTLRSTDTRGQVKTVSVANLTEEDLQAFGFTFDNLISGALPDTAQALINGLDPAHLATNGWPSPQVAESSLPQGFTRTLELGNGTTLVSTYNDDRRLVSLAEITARDSFQSTTQTYAINADGSRTLVSTASRLTSIDGSYVGTETDVITRQVFKLSGDPDGNTLRELNVDATANLRASDTATVFSDVSGLVGALKGGQPLPALASGLRLLNSVSIANGQPLPDLAAANNVAAGVLSFYNLYNAFNSGDDFSRVNATLSSINYANEFLLNTTASYSSNLSGFLNGTGSGSIGVLPALGLISSIRAGDPIGAAMSIGTLVEGSAFLTTNPVGWVLISAQILRTVLDKGPPDAWGTANVTFGEGITNYMPQVNATGENIGPDRVRGQLQNTVNALTSLIEANNAATADSTHHLGLIPQRLPSLNFKAAEFADKGYAVTDIDALTGAQRFANLRFDDNGQVFGLDPASITPELRAMLGVSGAPDYPALNAYMLNSALQRQAIAPMWEVQTAKMQQAAGDPNAGLTEEERAAKAGFAAAVDLDYGQAHPSDVNAGNKRLGHFMPIGLDLDGNGTVSTLTIAQTEADGAAVTFDWDGLGYQKQTGWIAENDGFLVLDRNFNESVDNGAELLSNPLVADPAKGLRSLAAFDANADGRIDASDPVYQQLRVWQDFNQDGNNTHSLAVGTLTEVAQDESNGIRELRSLADWGITAIDYANSCYDFSSVSGSNGEDYRQISTQTLDAESEGTLYTPVGAGIRIDATDARPEIVITQVLSEEAVYALYTLETAGETIGAPGAELYEDGSPTGYNPHTQGGAITITISAEQLLANDTWHGTSGKQAGLTITSVDNPSHLGSLNLTAEGNVSLTLEANYNGVAGFSYTVTAPDGQTRTAQVTLDVTPVNDAPSVAVQLDQWSIYGYGVLAKGGNVGTAEDSYWGITDVERSVGLPQDRPYLTVMGREQVGTEAGYGEDAAPVPVYGELVDTLIPETYFDEQYAIVEAHYDPESGPAPTSLEFKMGDAWVKVDVNPGTVFHDVPQVVESTNDGYVSAIDPDGAAQFSYELISQPLYGTVDLDGSTGRFDYTGRRYVDQNVKGENIVQNVLTDDAARNEERFTDYFTVRAHDGAGGFVDKAVGVTHYGPAPNPAVGGSGGKKPIAIDLDGNGFQFTDVNDSNVFMDVNGGGWKRRMAWIKPGDGLLAFDKDGSGKIEGIDEIAYVGYAPGQQTDLSALREAFDTNRNGVLDAGDDKWKLFGVWQDTNSNGVQEAGEFRTLTDMGISAIGLTSDGKFQVIDGQTVHGLAMATKTDGSTLAVADVTLRTRGEVQVTATQPGGSITTSTVSTFKFGPGQDFEGTAEKDLVFGTEASDAFRPMGGDDVIMDDGGNDGVDAGAGNDLIYTGKDNDIVNAGADDDTVFAGAGNDVVFGDGANESGDDLIMLEDGNDVAFGGAGNDFIGGGLGNDVLSGNAGNDKLFGEDGWDALFGQDGDDELWGGAGNDLLSGGEGNDLLAGGVGDDLLEGGAGDDTYEVNSAGDVVTELAGEGIDSVNAEFSYTLADPLENLFLGGQENLSGAGNAADNVLVGNGGNNILIGVAGNDVLDGGLGDDIMFGGIGNDTYVIDRAGDQVIEVEGEGTDTVRSRISTMLAANVENLILGGLNACDATGNELDNTLVGNVANNVLSGGAGADLMRGGRGDDTYIVDAAGDVVEEKASEGVDGIQSSVSYTLSANVENLSLTGADDIDARGNELANSLTGNAGANTLDGGLGDDVMAGGAGNDTYVVDSVGDTVVEAEGEGVETVLAWVSCGLSANVEKLLLTGGDDINGTGNDLNNTLRGNARANVLDGALGADAMTGGAGDDTYIVNDALDIVIEQVDEGVDTVLSSVSYALLDQVENLTLTGAADIDATGNALDNTLTGNSGSNLLDGGTGSDVMAGADGDDTYMVDDAGDAVTEWFDGGLDTVLASVNYVLPQSVERLRLNGIAMVATGNELDNWLDGNAQDNLIDGGAGADVMAGGGGNDTYLVDNAQDVVVERVVEGVDTVLAGVSYALADNVENLTLTGQTAADALGNALDNVILGNAANNLLDGGAGADVMAGGAGDDRYVVDNTFDMVIEAAAGGLDTVEASVDYVLSAEVENLVVSGLAAQGVGNALDNRMTGNASDNVLDGGAGADNLAGEDGNDLLFGGDGHDELYGGNGDDELQGDAGDDQLDGGNGDDLLIDLQGDNVFHGRNNDDVVMAGAGSDQIYTDNGCDIIQAGAGVDRIDTGNENDLVDAGMGDDSIDSGNSDDWIAAGRGNDVINGGNGHNLYAFNRGDGADIVSNSGNGRDTISLGGGIRYANMTLAKVGNDLILGVGQGDSMTLKNWYVGNNNKSVDTLQVITVGGDYDAASADELRNKQVEAYDFGKLVQQFDAARTFNARNARGWFVMNSLLDAHLTGNNTAALGGDLSYQFATTGGLTGIGVAAAQSSLAPGVDWQTLKSRSQLEQGSVRLM